MALVQSLVEELRSSKLHGTAKKRKSLITQINPGKLSLWNGFLLLFYIILLSNYLFLAMFVLVGVWAFSSCSKWGQLSSCKLASHCSGLSCCRVWALGLLGFSSCNTQAQQLWLLGFRAQAQLLWHTGLVAPQNVGSSWTRGWTQVSCIGRWPPVRPLKPFS